MIKSETLFSGLWVKNYTLLRDANASWLTPREQPDVVGESPYRGEEIWAPSAGLFAVAPGHPAGLSGCLQLAAFSGKRKTESDSLCSPKMPNQPWWVWLFWLCRASSSHSLICVVASCPCFTPPGWQVVAEEVRVWEDGGSLVRDQTGAIAQRETLLSSTT